jgi:hypothetical protein
VDDCRILTRCGSMLIKLLLMNGEPAPINPILFFFFFFLYLHCSLSVLLFDL